MTQQHAAPDRPEQLYSDTAQSFPELTEGEGQVQQLAAITPEATAFMMGKATEKVVRAADDALATTANDLHKPTPTQQDMAELIASGGCPPEALNETAERLARVGGLDPPGQVRITGWVHGGLVAWNDGVEFHTPAGQLMDKAEQGNLLNPLAPLVKAWPGPPAAYPSRHVNGIQRDGAVYSKTPALLAATMSSQVEIVQVNGEPFAGCQPGMPESARARAYRPKRVQGELFSPGPARIDGVSTNDLLLVGLDQWDLSNDERVTLRHDIIRLGRATYALTGRATIPEDVGARWLTGQQHVTETARRRWWDVLRAMHRMTVQVNPRTHRWLRLFDVDPTLEGDASIGPSTWWSASSDGSGPRSWRLPGSLWRPPLVGDAPTGYWGAVDLTVDGLEGALTRGPTTGRGTDGRVPDYLKPVRKGGPGPDVFIPWRNVLRLTGERAPDDDASSTLRVRYKHRVEALEAAGLMVNGEDDEAEAGATIEIVRRQSAGGRGKKAGLMVRASARFVEAYRLGQNSAAWTLLPSNVLFLPDASG